MKRKITLLLSAISIAGTLSAQTITQVATGLNNPAGICKDYNGNLIVAETGAGMNDGRVSMLDTLGNRSTIIYDLPSQFDTATNEVSGPWRTLMTPDSMLIVVVGGGPDTLGGVDSVMGSLLLFDMSGFMPGTDSMSIIDAVKIIHVQQWVYANGFFDSNIFSVYYDSVSNNHYVIDAGANAVLRIDSTATISVVDTFPAIPNPGPFPPFIDYVPTDIVGDSTGNLYVCNLTGFPFMPGMSEITWVDTSGAGPSTTIAGLSLCVDMEMDTAGGFYVLQFGNFDTSTFTPIPGSASLVHAVPGGTIDTIAFGFGPSAGMTTDWGMGFYVTEMMTGSVLHISDISTSVSEIRTGINTLSSYPNPFNQSLHVKFYLNEKSNVNCMLTDQLGKLIFSKDLGQMQQGDQSFEINSKIFDLSILKTGSYFITITTDSSRQTINILKE